MASQSTRRTLPRAAAFWVLAGLFLVLFFASAAASPLYGVSTLLLRPDDQQGPDDQQEGSRRESPGPAASIPADTAEAARAIGSAGGAIRHGVREPGRQWLPGDD